MGVSNSIDDSRMHHLRHLHMCVYFVCTLFVTVDDGMWDVKCEMWRVFRQYGTYVLRTVVCRETGA